MKTKLTLSLITTALLFTSTALLAGTSQKTYMDNVKDGKFKKEISQKETIRLHSIVSNVVKNHKDSLTKAPKEFIDGLSDTVMALRAIKANKIDDAKKILKKADKEFTQAFKKEPKLGLLPIRDNAEVITFNGSTKLIKHIKDSVMDLLKHNDTQLAIDMLEPLQDEIIMKVQYVPSYIYPKAIKDASQALKDGKNDVAFATILTALESTQIDTMIVPIPLITAQDMVLEASKLEKSHKKESLALLDMAQEELSKATLLGYTNAHQKDYKDISKGIEDIKTEIKGKNVVVKLYDDLLNKFKGLSNK